MRKTILFGCLLCSASYAAESTYVVRGGDVVSSVLKSHLSNQYGRSIAVYSETFRKALSEFYLLNPSISNINKIHVGLKINLPVVIVSESEVSQYQPYLVKHGDTLYKISRRMYPDRNPFDGISEIKTLNPKITGSLIYAGKTLNLLPSSEETSNKNRVPSQENQNLELETEIFNLERKNAHAYLRIFRNITHSSNKHELKKFIKEALKVAQTHENFHLQETFIELTSLLIRTKDGEEDIDALRDFFLTWKRVRQERHTREAK